MRQNRQKFNIVVMFVGCVCLWACGSQPIETSQSIGFIQDTSLVAHWSMDEGSGFSTADVTGNGLDGTLKNGAKWGKRGIVFDGKDDYVDVGTLSLGGNGLTLAAWFRSEDLANCSTKYHDCRIVSKASGTKEKNHDIMLSTIKVGSRNRLRFRLRASDSTKTLVASSGSIQKGTWIHAAAVYDGFSMYLYQDGVLVGKTTKTGAISFRSTVPMWIGGNPTRATARPWLGEIDDVRIYNRAFTASEVAELVLGSPSNQAPVVSNGAFEVVAGKTTEVLLEATDADEDPLTFRIVSEPAHGVLTGTGTTRSYTADVGYEGSDSFTFEVSDGRGGTAQGRITITVQAAPVDSSVVAHWTLAEGTGNTTKDVSGNGHTGRLMNGAGWSTRGIDLDGVDDYVDVGSFSLSGDALTVAAWFRSEDLANCSSTYHDCRIISQATGKSEQDHDFMVSTIKAGDGSTRLRFRLRTSGTTKTLVASSGLVTEATWTHVAAVYDGLSMYLYQDGVAVGQTSKNGTLTFSSVSPCWIGGNPMDATSASWHGQIDDVWILDRAMGEKEITELAEGNTPSPNLNQPPVAVFTWEPISLEAPFTVHFTGTSSSDLDGQIVSYSWNFGDGTTSNESSPTHVFAQEGTYSVTLRVTDNEGATHQVAKIITLTQPQNDCPNGTIDVGEDCDGTLLAGANCTTLGFDGGNLACSSICQFDTRGCFTNPTPGGSLDAVITPPSRTSGMVPLAILFKGYESTPRETIAKYTWDFGDGSSPFVGFNAAHVYEKPGTYTVTLQVEDSLGHADSATVTITSHAVSGTTYYVDAQAGNDDNPGTSTQQAWKTVAKALSAIRANTIVKPGDQVLFRRGQSFPMTQAASVRGTDGPINVGAYGDGNRPKLIFVGTQGDFELIDATSNVTDLRFMDLEIDGKNNGIYDCGQERVSVFRAYRDVYDILFLRNHMHHLSSLWSYSNQTMDRFFAFHNTGTDLAETGMYFKADPPMSVAIVGNTIKRLANHIAYNSGISDSVFADNQFGQHAFGRTFRITGKDIKNVVVKRNTFEGWIDPLTSDDCPVNAGGQGHNNGTRYHFSMIHLGPNGSRSYLLSSSHIDFSENIVTDAEKLISIGGGQYNVLISNNIFMTKDTRSVSRISIGAHVGHDASGNKNIKILNNTFVLSGAGPALGITNYDSTSGIAPLNHEDIIFQNNIVVNISSNPGPAIYVDNSQGLLAELTSENNLFSNTAGFNVSGEMHSLANWQNLTGKDLQSNLGDPLFVDMLGPDGVLATFDESLELVSQSPAIDQGAPVEEICVDFQGGSRPRGSSYDIGAYEY